MKRSLTRYERLAKAVDIRRVFRYGKRRKCHGLKLLYAENDLPTNRIVIVAGKKLGNAVRRNRERRLIREVFRNSKGFLRTGYDMVFIPHKGDYAYEERLTQFRNVAERANLWSQHQI